MDVENRIKTLNDDILNAEEEGDEASLKRHLVRDFGIIRATGVRQNRDEYLGAVPGNARRGRSASMAEVRLFDNFALFTCMVTTTQNPEGTPSPGRFWNTRLFIKENGEWRCLIWQVTKILETPS